MTRARDELGRHAEAAVAALLVRRGFQIVGRNVRIGRLELDIIARGAGLVVICEVRARRSATFMHPIESIDRSKVMRIRRAAAAWMAREGVRGAVVRFDAAALIGDESSFRIDYFEDAF